MSSLELRDVAKRFGAQKILKGIDLVVEAGEFMVIVGPSGCGKSTLLRLISGLEDITGGDLTISGRRMNEVPPAKRGVAMVFQSYALYPHLNVRDNIAFGLKVRRLPRAEIDQRVRDAAQLLKLDGLLDRLPRELSGGQRQRVAIGRAIVGKPEIFLFDEPLSNLDAELRVHMRAEIAALHQRLGSTVIYVTHDQIEAMTLADRIVVLRDGEVEQVGSPRELYERPRNTFVATFIGSPRMNLLDAGLLEAQGMEAKGAVQVGLRPEHLVVTAPGSGQLSGKVLVSEYMGADTLLTLALCNGETCLTFASGDRPYERGSPVALSFSEVDLHRFDADGLRVESG